MLKIKSVVFLLVIVSFRAYAQQPQADLDKIKKAMAVLAQPLDAGPYTANEKDLKAIPCPEWFRDAKFGIWSHWSPASVPGISNGYPADMYHEGSSDYKYQLAHYGHPSQAGFKEVIKSWKAEKFDPEGLMKKYVAAGAKYFFAISCHHDNFDNYASSYTRWNSVDMGPHRDIIGDWAKLTKKYGVRFGVSSHADRAWYYYSASYGADTIGPKKGIPYDGNDPENWSLYQKPHNRKDKASDEFIALWYARHKELIDKYQPDLLYFDGSLPFAKEAGLKLASEFYNVNAKKNGGKTDGVINVKGNFGIRDLERGVYDTIRTEPWQSDTSLGGWFYLDDQSTQKNDTQSHSKSATTMIHTLADIVSKNGNLLLNFPQRGDGSLYPECEVVLAEFAKWMPINGEAIFGTRPWTRYGEGPSEIKFHYMNEIKKPLTAQDIRFTTKGDILYAIILGWPGDGATTTIKSLATGQGKQTIKTIKLLGYQGNIKYTRTTEGLTVTMPDHKPCDHAVTLKIE
jgi:alpha-L-fucosidase